MMMIFEFLKRFRYVIFGILVIAFVIAYDYFKTIHMVKAVKPSNNQCATGDSSAVKKYGLFVF